MTATSKNSKARTSTKGSSKPKGKASKPKVAKAAKVEKPLTFQPAVTKRFAKDIAAARKSTKVPTVRKDSQGDRALRILGLSKSPMTIAMLVEAFKKQGEDLNWPNGLIDGLERRGLIRKLRADNGRIQLEALSKGQQAVAAK